MIDESANNKNASKPSNRSSVGKIGRLPNDIREQINQRILDGQPTAFILHWLNELPPVKEILALQFNGTPIKYQNVDNWRQTGYQLWLKQKQSCLRLDRLAEDAQKVSSIGRAALAHGAATILSGQIFQKLDSAGSEKPDIDDFIKMVSALKPLLNAEHAVERLQLARQRVRQRDQMILLTRDKLQRDTTAVAIHVLHDARAKQVEACGADYAAKIEIMGRHLFGELWEPRPVTDPNHPPLQIESTPPQQ